MTKNSLLFVFVFLAGCALSKDTQIPNRVVVCEECSGQGIVEYKDRPYIEDGKFCCPMCRGSGTLLEER